LAQDSVMKWVPGMGLEWAEELAQDLEWELERRMGLEKAEELAQDLDWRKELESGPETAWVLEKMLAAAWVLMMAAAWVVALARSLESLLVVLKGLVMGLKSVSNSESATEEPKVMQKAAD